MKYSAALVTLGGLGFAAAECVADCEASVASDLGCDLTDVTGCYCPSAFATAVKACLFETTDCGRTYVTSFYAEYDAACASVSGSGVTGTATEAAATTSAAATSAAASTTEAAAASTTSEAATATSSTTDACGLDSCAASAASSLGCDVTDLAGCYCLDDFATAGKSCLYGGGCSTLVSTWYTTIEDTCADVSASSAVSSAAASTAAASSSVAATSAAASSAAATTVSTSKTSAAATTTSKSVASTGSTATTSSGATVVTAGANHQAAGGIVALAVGAAGMVALL